MDTLTDRQPAIEITMAATPVWIPVARAVATQLADRANFDSDATCDIRVAVDEACAPGRSDARRRTMTCAFTVSPAGWTSSHQPRDPRPGAFAALAWRLLRAVTDELTLCHQPGRLFSIRLSIQSPTRHPEVPNDRPDHRPTGRLGHPRRRRSP